MNAVNRKRLNAIIERLEELKEDAEAILEEEEEKRDNTPDNLLGSAPYARREEVCSNLDDAVSNLEEVISSIEAAME